jgi:hypothetical protein
MSNKVKEAEQIKSDKLRLSENFYFEHSNLQGGSNDWAKKELRLP